MLGNHRLLDRQTEHEKNRIYVLLQITTYLSQCSFKQDSLLSIFNLSEYTKNIRFIEMRVTPW